MDHTPKVRIKMSLLVSTLKTQLPGPGLWWSKSRLPSLSSFLWRPPPSLEAQRPFKGSQMHT